MEFNLFKDSKFPSILDDRNSIDLSDNLVRGKAINKSVVLLLSIVLLKDYTTEDENVQIAFMCSVFKVFP